MKGWPIIAAGVALAGCAGIDVQNVRTDPNAAFGPPEAFYVQDFSYDRAFKGQAAETTGRDDHIASFHNLTRDLSARLRTELMDLAPVYVLKPTATSTRNRAAAHPHPRARRRRRKNPWRTP